VETMRLLELADGEAAVRFLFSRPEKLLLPTLQVVASLAGGPAAIASLLTFMSPVQAFRYASRPEHFGAYGLWKGDCEGTLLIR
jgi:hypothetical protein